MSVQELRGLIGQTKVLETYHEGMKVIVEITDAKKCFGRVDCLVIPSPNTAKSKAVWVSQNSLKKL